MAKAALWDMTDALMHESVGANRIRYLVVHALNDVS